VTTAVRLPAEQEAVPEGRSHSPWRIALRSLLHRKLAVVAIAYILLFYTVAVFAPVLAPYSYTAQDLKHAYAAPTAKHPFGTDQLGRDVLSRVILATRTTMVVTIASAITGGFLIPIVLGLLAGYRAGWVDSLINRFGEALGSLPPLLLLILLTATLRPRFDAWLSRFNHVPFLGDSLQAGGADLVLIFTALSLIGWVGGERLIRAQVLAVRQTEYVQAARSMGASVTRILVRHLFPNIAWIVVVGISSSLGGIALAEIGLTFLGLGVRPPTPSLGAMIYEGSGPRQVAAHPNLLLVPGVIAVLLFLSFNLLGDALNDVLNPHTR
jgi:peptide/nickel transport system permease protein